MAEPSPTYSDPAANAANAIALPIFAVLSSLVIILPFRSFYVLRSFPACSLCVSVWIINLGTFLNAVLWPTDDWTKWWAGYGLCDIESILRWPITLASVTSLTCFTKGLADALDTDGAILNPTKGQRRRKLYFEILLCWGPPVLQAALHYIVQAGRYAIVPVFGCTDEVDNSWPYIVILISWAPVFTLLTCYYSILLLIRLKRHRKTISAALRSTGSGMVPRKFVKLAMIAVTVLTIYFPVQILFIFRSFPRVWVPYSWSRVHDPEYFSSISYYHTEDVPLLQYTGWAAISEGFLLMLFYGFSDEAIATYRSWMVVIGLGSIWPSLKEPYRPRGRGSSTGGSTLSGGRFDIVGKAMKYFDTESSRTGSRASSRHRSRSRHSTEGSRSRHSGSRSRKTSQGTIMNLGSQGTSAPLRKDLMTPSSEKTAFSHVSELLHPSGTSNVTNTKHKTLFSTIRAFNPFTLFLHSRSLSSNSWSPNTSSNPNSSDPEKGSVSPLSPSPPSGDMKDLETHNYSTAIWSSGSKGVGVGSGSGSGGSRGVVEREMDIEPASQVLGSRAYRERERREMERVKREREQGVVIETEVEVSGAVIEGLRMSAGSI